MAVVEAIATTYLEADATSITFDLSSSPANTYEDLQLRGSVRTTRATALEPVAVQFNGDTGANYQTHKMAGYGTSQVSGGEFNQVRTHVASVMPTNTDKGGFYGYFVCDISDYRNANKNTTLSYVSGENGSDQYVVFGSGMWDNQTAKPHSGVTSIKIYPNNGSDFTRGSEFTLYGLNSA
tara:strand:+ start:808 stop:1347 length:540 start_codon:yes stop_codon:yes gene_type:complete